MASARRCAASTVLRARIRGWPTRVFRFVRHRLVALRKALSTSFLSLDELVRQVRLELTVPCLRGRCLDPVWLLTRGGTERTRTVIGLADNQVPHLSATVPCFESMFGE